MVDLARHLVNEVVVKLAEHGIGASGEPLLRPRVDEPGDGGNEVIPGQISVGDSVLRATCRCVMHPLYSAVASTHC